MRSSLKAYKIGLGVLAIFAVGLAVYVFLQAGATKQDSKINDEANTISNTLNSYVDDNEIIPTTLAEAGIKNVPSTISYQRLSNSQYKFCITYKTTSSGFDATGTVTDMLTGGQIYDSGGDFSDNSDLYISDTYHKGVNCQTVDPSWVGSTLDQSVTQNSGSNSQNVCNYQAVEKNCQESCPGYAKTANSQIVYDGTVSTIVNDGSDEILTVDVYGTTTTPATAYQIVSNTNTTVSDSECDATEASTITEGDRVRVGISGSPTSAATKLEASYIIDFDE